MSHVTQKLAQNTAIQIMGKGVGTVLSLATFAILVNHLDIERFGALTIALNFAAIFAILVDFGLTLTTTQMISKPGADEEKLLGNLLTLRAISAFTFLSSGATIAFLLPYTIDIKIAAAIACLSFFFGSVATMCIGVFQKRLALGRAVLAENLNRGAVTLLAVLVTLVTPSIILAASIFAIGAFVQLVVTLFFVHRHVTIRPQISWVVWKKIIVKSWPIGISIAFNLIYLKGDIFFMSLFHIPDAAIGLYGASYKVVDVMTTVPVMFMGLLLPLLAHAWAKNDRHSFKNHLQQGFDAFCFLAIPFAFGAIAEGGRVLALIKPELSAAGTIMAILGTATSVVFFGSLFGHAIVAVQKQRQMLWGYFAVALLSTLGYVIFIPTSGILAAAWVTLFSEILIALIAAIVVFRVSKTRLNVTMFLRATLSSIVMFVALTLLTLSSVILSILFGVTVYLLVLWTLGGPSPKKLMLLAMPSRL